MDVATHQMALHTAPPEYALQLVEAPVLQEFRQLRVPDKYAVFSDEFAKYRDVHCTVSHPQLCHQLGFNTSDNTDLYYASKTLLKVFNTTTKITSTVLELPYRIQSMAVEHDIAATCGANGQLTVIDLKDNYHIIFDGVTTAEGQMNNAINIAKHQTKNGLELRITTSSNDKTISIFRISPRFECVSNIEFSICMNYASVSPDGKRMIAIGDKNIAWIFEISAEDGYKEIGNVMIGDETSQGCCFSADWNKDGTQFAILQQIPGIVGVFSITEDEEKRDIKLITFLYPQERVTDEFRSVKFYSPPNTSRNFLIYSENIRYIHIMDADSWSRKQVIEIPQILKVVPPSAPLFFIGGVAVTSDLSKLYAAKTDGLFEFNLIDVKSLKEICLEFVKDAIQSPEVVSYKSILPKDLVEEINSPLGKRRRSFHLDGKEDSDSEQDEEDDEAAALQDFAAVNIDFLPFFQHGAFHFGGIGNENDDENDEDIDDNDGDGADEHGGDVDPFENFFDIVMPEAMDGENVQNEGGDNANEGGGDVQNEQQNDEQNEGGGNDEHEEQEEQANAANQTTALQLQQQQQQQQQNVNNDFWDEEPDWNNENRAQ